MLDDGIFIRTTQPNSPVPGHSYWFDARSAPGTINGWTGSAWAPLSAASATTLTVQEADGSPSVGGVTTIKVTSGSLIDNGGGTVTILTGSSAPGGSGNTTANQFDILIGAQHQGPAFPFIAPDPNVFSFVNQGAATLGTSYGGIYLSAPGEGNATDYHTVVTSLPTAPYTLTAALVGNYVKKDFLGSGVCWYDSTSSKAIIVQLFSDGNIYVSKFTTLQAISAHYLNYPVFTHPMFVQLTDSGSERNVNLSWNGKFFINIHTVANSDFMLATHAGIGVSPQNAVTPNLAAGTLLISWDMA